MKSLSGPTRRRTAVAVLCALLASVTARAQDAPPPALPGQALPVAPTAFQPPSVLPGVEVPPVPPPGAPTGFAEVPVPGAGAPPAGAPVADPLAALDAVRAPTAPEKQLGADHPPMPGAWHNGLRFISEDKNFTVFLAGRMHFDTVSYAAPTGVRRNIPGNNPLEDGVAFRRARITIGGTIYKNFEFLTEYDFFNGFITSAAENRQANVPVPTDLWVQFKELPWIGNVRIGNQKQLYSFEHHTSSRFLNFIERSLGFDAFAENQNNGFQPGITVFDTYADKHGTWGVGLFKYTRSIFGTGLGRNEVEVNARGTYLPVYEEGGRTLVHVGVGRVALAATGAPYAGPSFTSALVGTPATSTKIRLGIARGSTRGVTPARSRRWSRTPATSSAPNSSR